MAHRKHHRVHRRHRRNPMFGGHRRHHRRNPMFGGISPGDMLETAVYGTGGFVGARALPQMFLGASNQGVMGYAANLAAALGLGFVAKFISPKAGSSVIVGGIIGTAARILSDVMGQGAFGGALGDLQYDLGFYINNTFPLPTTGQGPYLLNPGVTGGPMANGGVSAPIVVTPASGSPTAQAAAAAGGDHSASGRWGSRWAA